MEAAIQTQMVLDVESWSGTLRAVSLPRYNPEETVRTFLMPINVVCTGCRKRFQVADAHAGKTGPCPSCQKPIKIPRPEDEVVIQEPENFGPCPNRYQGYRKLLSPNNKLSFHYLVRKCVQVLLKFESPPECAELLCLS